MIGPGTKDEVRAATPTAASGAGVGNSLGGAARGGEIGGRQGMVVSAEEVSHMSASMTVYTHISESMQGLMAFGGSWTCKTDFGGS